MESGFGHFDNGHQLVPLMLLENVAALRLGLGARWFCHLLWLSWGLVLLCAGENGGDLHCSEGKSPFGFSALLWFALFNLNVVILLTHIVFDFGCK